MKPTFPELFKLTVLLTVLLFLSSVVLGGYANCQSIVVSAAGVSGSDPGSAVGFLWQMFTWVVYLFVLGLAAGVAILVLHACGVLVTIAERLGQGVQWFAALFWKGSATASPVAITADTPISFDGQMFTLRSLLSNYARKIVGKDDEGNLLTVKDWLERHESRVAQLELLTAQLEPPPPPKSPEEMIAELQAQLESQRAEVERLRAAKSEGA